MNEKVLLLYASVVSSRCCYLHILVIDAES